MMLIILFIELHVFDFSENDSSDRLKSPMSTRWIINTTLVKVESNFYYSDMYLEIH